MAQWSRRIMRSEQSDDASTKRMRVWVGTAVWQSTSCPFAHTHPHPFKIALLCCSGHSQECPSEWSIVLLLLNDCHSAQWHSVRSKGHCIDNELLFLLSFQTTLFVCSHLHGDQWPRGSEATCARKDLNSSARSQKHWFISHRSPAERPQWIEASQVQVAMHCLRGFSCSRDRIKRRRTSKLGQ